MAKQFNVSLKIDMDGNFITESGKALNRATALQTKLGVVQATANRMKTQFMSGLKLAAPIAAVGFFAAKWEEGLAKLSTVTNVTLKDIKTKFGPGLKNIARETGQTLGQVVEAAYQASSAGVSNEKLIQSTRVAAKLAVGGFTDVKTAIDALTNVQNVWGVSFEKASDILVNTQNLGKTTVGEIGRSIAQVSAIAKSAGISFEEVSASVATLTKGGLPTAEAFTAVRGSIVALLKQTPKQKKALKEIGSEFSLEQIKSQGYGKSLIDLMAKINAHSGSENKRKKILSDVFGRVEGLNAALGLTAKEGQKTFDEAMKRNNASTDSASKAFKTMSQTTAQQFKRMKVELQIFAVQIGSVLLPAINGLFNTIRPVISSIGRWAKENKGLVKGLGIGLSIIVGLKLAIGTLGFVLVPVITTVKGLAFAIGAVKAASLGLGAIFMGGLGIGVVVGGIVLMIKHWDKLVAVLKGVAKALRAVWNAAVSAFKKVKSVVTTSAVGGLVESSGPLIEKLAEQNPEFKKRAIELGMLKTTASVPASQNFEQKNNVTIQVSGAGNPSAVANRTKAALQRQQLTARRDMMSNVNRVNGRAK